MKGKTNKEGFTFIELIIAIAILSVIAAIAVPLVVGHIERARTAADLSNLRTLNSVTGIAALNHTGPLDNFYKTFSEWDDDGRWNHLINEQGLLSIL